MNTPYTGVMEGLVAGVWAAWPFFHKGSVMRYNFLHPVPRRYKTPLKQAFAKVRQIISDKTYNFGDKWHVSTADTTARRITATLRFTEEESQGFEGTNLANIRHKTQRVQRLLELDVQMKEEPNDVTVVQFDFRPRVEGVAFHACDSIIAGIVSDVEAALGPGTDAGNAADTSLPAPPWWLIGVGGLGLLQLWGDVMKAVFGQ
ncbi:MAG: hypothetical protein KGS72_27880 [Cyanobacteria bacterium REEB67]|nr:hypothetical protein [Cyanobacteria bacterium REEB67]